MEEQYRDHLSNYHQWDQLDHAKEWILFPENIGSSLSIDETSLSQGELYTVITNKAAKGKKGAGIIKLSSRVLSHIMLSLGRFRNIT